MKDKKKRKTRANRDLEDTNSKVVTLSPGASAGDENADPDPVDDSGEAEFSASSLEHDLKKVQSRWRAVEGEIADRDEKIRMLESAIDSDCEKVSTLEAELESMSSHNEELSDQLAIAEQEIGEWREKCAEFESELQSRDADAPLVQNEEFDALKATNAELREHVLELQDYIDGRKRNWEEMRSQLQRYEDTIRGMSDSVGSHVDIVAGIEAEKAALAQNIVGLERDLAVLKGQQSDREANRLEMQDTLDKKTRELGSLSGETSMLNERIEELQQQLDEQIANNASLEEQLASEKSRFDKQLSHLEDLEKSLGSRGDTERSLQRKLTAVEARLRETSDKAAREEIRSTELDAMLRESQVERRNLEKEIQAQRELIETLENEVDKKRENLNALDHSVDQISTLGGEISELDLLIDDRWHQQHDAICEGSEDLFEQADEELLAVDELISADDEPMADDEQMAHVLVASKPDRGMEIHYPLTRKEMTIGRAQENDIRLDSKYVSRVHARITVIGPDVYIEDAGSMNGFLINSRHTTRHKLSHGDTVQFGLEKFRYLAAS